MSEAAQELENLSNGVLGEKPFLDVSWSGPYIVNSSIIFFFQPPIIAQLPRAFPYSGPTVGRAVRVVGPGISLDAAGALWMLKGVCSWAMKFPAM